MVEDHGDGQLGRFRLWPRFSRWTALVAGLLFAIGVTALAHEAHLAGIVSIACAIGLVTWMFVAAGAAITGLAQAIERAHGSLSP